eukprot:CAMPEP_0184516176 /NCGR_PEP_ID=MMETSP0198_2-20121128/4889_1 /TAXON_ID=1112570 /ORGANISM="Thraustochytrium sp., Strain LLF1b" /LENGTH=350 /DNA_ID=CAMNT_0026906479 /DNA_START=92 /DNA_END=1140 /DNA_ORIENTATION=-
MEPHKASNLCHVGARVRVLVSGPGEKVRRRRGIVAIVDDNEVEVLLDAQPQLLAGKGRMRESQEEKLISVQKTEQEEVCVPLQNVTPLEPFELQDQNSEERLTSVKELMAQAARLFALQDLDAGRSALICAIRLLSGPLSEGALAVYFCGQFDADGLLPDTALGMVLTLDDNAELMIDNDKEIVVRCSDLIAIPHRYEEIILFMDCLNDLAKASLMLAPPAIPHALESTAVTITLAKCLMDPNQEHIAMKSTEDLDIALVVNEPLFKAHMLKSRSHVLQNKFRAAAGDIRQAIYLKPKDKKAREMVEIIKQRYTRDAAQNRQLARHITRWVDSVMRKSPAFADNFAAVDG